MNQLPQFVWHGYQTIRGWQYRQAFSFAPPLKAKACLVSPAHGGARVIPLLFHNEPALVVIATAGSFFLSEVHFSGPSLSGVLLALQCKSTGSSLH